MSSISVLKKTGRDFLRARAAAHQGLKTRSFNEWLPELDEVLRYLPETDTLPHELFRMLMKMSEPDKRKIILVTEQGAPVALAGLRNRSGCWEPVTQWIVPGVLFPVKDGYLPRVLPALGYEMRIAWWRWFESPPLIGNMSNSLSEPTYGMSLDSDFEKYWSTTSHLRNVRTYRNRCKGFELKINSPGAIEWIVRNWASKWRTGGISETPDLSERLLAAQYLQEQGRYFALMLFDGDEPIAGGTLMIHRNEAVAHCSYRDPKYDWHGVMTRHIDLTISWAKSMGLQGIDLGGSYAYKKIWAPENGEKWKFEICPDNVRLERKALQFVKRVNGMLP